MPGGDWWSRAVSDSSRTAVEDDRLLTVHADPKAQGWWAWASPPQREKRRQRRHDRHERQEPSNSSGWWWSATPEPDPGSPHLLSRPSKEAPDSASASAHSRGVVVGLASAAALCAALAFVCMPGIARWGQSRCLCLFDVDRTLTAKQGLQAECNLPEGEQEAFDTAFGGGPLLLSLLGQAVSDTACGPCQKGIVSNGDASGPRERDVLAERLGHQSGVFSHWEEPSSPFVKGCPNGQKQECAKRLLDWFEREKGTAFSPDRVFFFDDMAMNVKGFEGSGMNAHQISCGSQDGEVGRCGGRPEEISLAPGVALCP